jgi:hypothetical protein
VELEWNDEDHFWQYKELFQSYIKYESTVSFKVAGTGNKNRGNAGTRSFVIHRLLLIMTMIFGLHKFQLRSGHKNMAKDVHKWQDRFQDRGMSHYFDLSKESPKLRYIAKLMEKRVKGIKFRQKVDISHEAAQVMKLPAAPLVHEIEAIAAGLAQTSATDDTLLVYTQCLLDAFRAQLVIQESQTDEMADLRHVVGTWHRRFRNRNVTLIPGSMYRGGVQMDHYDVASLLLGDGYDGWLNGDLIRAILTVTATNSYVVPARAFDFWHQGNHAENMFDIPGAVPDGPLSRNCLPIPWASVL